MKFGSCVPEARCVSTRVHEMRCSVPKIHALLVSAAVERSTVAKSHGR
jgi:hypothetical protein